MASQQYWSSGDLIDPYGTIAIVGSMTAMEGCVLSMCHRKHSHTHGVNCVAPDCGTEPQCWV